MSATVQQIVCAIRPMAALLTFSLSSQPQEHRLDGFDRVRLLNDWNSSKLVRDRRLLAIACGEYEGHAQIGQLHADRQTVLCAEVEIEQCKAWLFTFDQ